MLITEEEILSLTFSVPELAAATSTSTVTVVVLEPSEEVTLMV